MPLPAAGSFPTGTALRGLIAALIKDCAAFAQVATSETTTSATYTNLATAGPAVSVTSVYDRALIFWSASQFNNNASHRASSVVEISGATTLAASASNGARENGGNIPAEEQMQFMFVTINPGSNTYTMKYAASGGTALFERRRLYVIAP